ncbi:MAG TPA: hypothetical protein PKC24_06960 [Cyclobacteriaceae bacterium]|nr:hypothetical protein [Cyclobacteriaceae bacterium]
MNSRLVLSTILLLITAQCFPLYLAAQNKLQHENEVQTVEAWLGFRRGFSNTPIPDFPVWGATEGLVNLPDRLRNQLIGFDVFLQKGRLPFLFSTELNLPRLLQTYPYLTNISFEAGYVLLDERVNLRLMAGPGIGVMTIRFVGGIPDSFRNLPYNHSEAIARAHALSLRASLLASYPIFPRKEIWGKPVLLANLGLQQRLLHSGFRYGEPDFWTFDERFISEPVDIPKFYKRSLWLSVGLAFRMI